MYIFCITFALSSFFFRHFFVFVKLTHNFVFLSCGTHAVVFV